VTVIEPIDVLRMQADLRDRLRNPTVRRGVAAQYNDMHGGVSSEAVAEGLRQSVNAARAYRVEGQMTAALRRRGESLAIRDQIGMPPTPNGFVVFEEPMISWEARGREEKIHVLTWAPVQIKVAKPQKMHPNGWLVSTWNDIVRGPDQVYTELIAPLLVNDAAWQRSQASFGRWNMTNCGSFWSEFPVGPLLPPLSHHIRDRILADGGTPVENTRSIFRDVSALWAMLSERIPATDQRKAQLTRTETKQARREGLEPEVILVTLRPEYRVAPEQKGTGKPITVQYEVDDFYRTIHRGTERERRIRVRGHRRGPEGAPWSKKKTVYNLAR